MYELEYINQYGRSITFSWASGFILSKTTGLTSNAINTTNTQGINQVGGTLQGQSIQPRIITCSGTIRGNSLVGKRDLISTILPGVQAQLIYNKTWQINVVPKSTPNISNHIDNATFDFILEAAYPYWNKAAQTVTAMSYMKPLFKFPWNLTKPWRFSERVEVEFSVIQNEGNVPTGFTIVFRATGTVSVPMILKASTLEFIKINRIMEPGEIITVENLSDRITATSNIDGDIFNDIDFESTFFQLNVGDNVLRHDADGNRSGLIVNLIHSTTSVGAYTE